MALIAATPLLAQVQKPVDQHKAPGFPAADEKRFDQVDALQNRAREILKTELARQPDPACDPDKLSSMELDGCAAADEAVTERNYRAFLRALKASLAIQGPDIDPKILHPPSKNLAAGEVAWRTYLNKTCAAVVDGLEGGTIAPVVRVSCLQNLTQQHMKELADLFLQQ